MSVLEKINYYTEEAYLHYEQAALTKHEYVDGQIYAMAGASENHNRLSMNLGFHLRSAARGGDCGVFINDMKLRIPHSRSYYYPDVMLLCQPSSEDDDYYKHQPCFIAEVLSKSTQSIDRREKLLNYQKIHSLHYYLMVDSTRRHVDYLQRNDSGDWQRATLEANETLIIQCKNYQASLTLASIYEDIKLPFVEK